MKDKKNQFLIEHYANESTHPIDDENELKR
jgi:hypothetical protein